MQRRSASRHAEKPKGSESGFSLVELMVSLAVFAIFAVAVGTSISAHYKTTATLKTHDRAVAGCQQTMQAILALDWNTMVAQNGASFAVGGVLGGGSIEVSNDLNGDGDILDPDEGTANLYRVTTTLNTIQITTYRTREGI